VRKLIVAMSALAAATPALAQPPRPDPRDEALVRRIPPPEQIERMGDAIARVTDALMDVDIGPIVDAIDPAARRYRRGPETLGDLATRNDPYARERIRDEVGAATVGLGAAAEEMKVVTPVIRRSLEDAAARMEDAMEQARERTDERLRRDRPRGPGGRD
jgi:hypothetical protein